MASSLLDVCRFSPTAGGTTDWTYSSAATGYQSPTAAGVVNGAQYSYRAESADLTQWEIGQGTYNTGTGVLARTTVLFNSSGTTSKINFSTVPTIAIVALKEDLKVAPTRQVLTSGTSATYTTPAGCLYLKVTMVGGGGGSAGSGTSPGAAGDGGASTFSSFTANGGAKAVTNAGGAGGAATGGSINFTGVNGASEFANAISTQVGGCGGNSVLFSGAAVGQASSGVAVAGIPNTGGGASGAAAGTSITPGGGGGGAGSLIGWINNPAATYTYTVGAGGTAGTAGGSGNPGAAGGSGIIIVEEFYN